MDAGRPRRRSSTRTAPRRRRPPSRSSPPATRRRSSSPPAPPGSRAASSTRSATCSASALQAEHWFGVPRGRARLVHGRAGLVEVDPQRLPRALADRRRRRPPRRPLRPRRTAATLARRWASTSSARRRPSTGCSPSAASCAPVPSLRRLVSAGEPIEPEVIRPLREATRAADRRRLRPDRDRARSPACTLTTTTPARDGSMGRPLPGIETRIVEGELQLRAASSPTFFAHYLDGERFDGRVVADRRPGARGRGRLPLVRGPRRRPDPLLRLPDRPLRGRVGARSPTPRSPRPRRSPPPTPSAASVVRAIVVLRDREPSEELARELQEHVKAQTAPYKYPRIVEFADRAAEDDERQDQASGAARRLV